MPISLFTKSRYYDIIGSGCEDEPEAGATDVQGLIPYSTRLRWVASKSASPVEPESDIKVCSEMKNFRCVQVHLMTVHMRRIEYKK